MSIYADKDFATGKPVNLNKPEERVRQEFERYLHHDFGYPKNCMDIEVPIQMGSNRKACDIAIFAPPPFQEKGKEGTVGWYRRNEGAWCQAWAGTML